VENVQLIQQIQQQLKQLKCKGVRIEILWNKAHAKTTLKWNTMVDELAKQAAASAIEASAIKTSATPKAAIKALATPKAAK
jgi:hypothetical protein